MQIFLPLRNQRVSDPETKQVPAIWQGRGAGRLIVVGSAPFAAAETAVVRGFRLAGAKEAEARPAKATNRAKKRMAAFIFGNLPDLEFRES